MAKIFKWALPILIIIQIILVSFNLLSLSTMIMVSVFFEVLVLLIATRQFLSSAKVFSANRRQGQDKWTSFENSLEVITPALVAKLFISELKILGYTGLWLFRRIKIRENEFTYHHKSMFGAFVLLVLFITPVEIFIMGLLLPLEWLKWLLAILSVYAFVWLLGVWASMSALPHKLDESGLTIHNGIFAKGYLPYSDIETIVKERTENLSWDGLSIDKKTGIAYSSNGGTTDVLITLRKPIVFKKWLSLSAPVNTIHLAIDEPATFIIELEKRLSQIT